MERVGGFSAEAAGLGPVRRNTPNPMIDAQSGSVCDFFKAPPFGSLIFR
ncbi:MAG: hypothetical protein KJ970_13690 [Candidatus Eisenbacteria bacterium]|uniref:Uncharacterized protein n=1 Tax=Eiseniibacteriota bacterium TaxID=2212470 RepID=A0A948RYK2_UNCEI|nr:hypothetical protein [Candidatus Eisenbacteria bacterium]